jgi:hypothetical protein
MENIKKQKEVKAKFDVSQFSNVSKGKTVGKESLTTEKNNELATIKFKVHNDQLESFHNLKMDYARENKKFNLSNNEMFVNCILFLKKHFENKKIFLKCPLDFKEAIIKPGKRKATERTFSKDVTSSIIFTIDSEIADHFMDLMFSYIKNDPKDNIFNDHHSRTYFFYDFISLLNTNKSKLLKFN